MRMFKFKFDIQTIYFSFIRPVIEYSDVVWDNCTLYEANELEKIQLEAVCIVTGATKLVSTDPLCTETGWEILASNFRFSIKCRRVSLLNIFHRWYRAT